MTRRERKDAAWKYIRRIRNVDKREYAIRYFNYLVGFSPDPEPHGVSPMAARAIRMRLFAILEPVTASAT